MVNPLPDFFFQFSLHVSNAQEKRKAKSESGDALNLRLFYTPFKHIQEKGVIDDIC